MRRFRALEDARMTMAQTASSRQLATYINNTHLIKGSITHVLTCNYNNF